jgi:serine/threonine protein kinase
VFWAIIHEGAEENCASAGDHHMSPERYQQIKQLFARVADLPAKERPAALDRLCGGDPELRAEVERVLASDRGAGKFMEQPALAPVGRIVPQAVKESLVGSRVGRYEILSEIGRGGMGTVYLASRADDQYRKLVAIKVVNPGQEAEAMAARFRRERQILANLEHSNIAQLLDGGTAPDGSPYLVMEYVGGMPIDEYCDSRRLSVAERLKLFRTVCAAVHYAHQNLIVHRDLKPTNILVKADGTIKLLDFGIAKLLNPDPARTPLERTATAMRIMTPEYASPEQARGDAITTASDVYTLGVVLYELLSGHRPYRSLADILGDRAPECPSTAAGRTEQSKAGDGEPVARTPTSVAAERKTRPASLRRKLAGDLDAIVLKALEKNPSHRYGSVERLADDIQRHLAGLPVAARRDTTAYRLSKFLCRHKAAVGVLVLLFAILAATAAVAAWQVTTARAEQSRIQHELEDARREIQLLRRESGHPR